MRFGVSIVIAGIAGALIGGLAIGVSAYFWIGEASGDRKLEELTLPQSATNQNRKTDSTKLNLKGVASESTPHAQIRTIQDLASRETDFDRSMSIYLLIANANEDTLETYIRQSMEIPSTKQRSLVLSILFSRYAALDPQLALDQFLQLDRLTIDQKYDLMEQIFNEWMSNDLDGTVAAIAALPQEAKELAAEAVMSLSEDLPTQERMELARLIGPNDTWIEFRINWIRRESYKDDPRSAFYARIGDKSQTSGKYSDLLSIAEYWFEIDGASVIPEITGSISNTEMRRNLLNNLIWQIIRKKKTEPSAILNVVMDLPDKRGAQLASENVLNAWGMWDPQQAFETSLKYDDHLITRETRASLLDGWARQDPEGLYAKAASFPIDYRNTAVIAALGQMASDAPEEAVRLASELETSMLKAAAKGEILDHWSSKDAKSAVEWFVEDSVDESAEEPVRDLIYAFQSYMRQDFDAALNYVDQYDGKLKSWFVEAIAHHLARFDAERAIEYLPNVDEESRDWIVSTIGYELVRLDPSKALAFGETIKASRKDEYYQDMLFSWANYDLMALYRNLQKVPHDYRAVAATKLLNENETKHFLSEREIQQLESIVSSGKTPNQSD